MKSLKGTRTEANILTAFAGESQARNRYDYFSSAAKKEGLVLVSQIFAETALQEKEHAKRLFKFLEGGEVEANLLASAASENHEHTEMYPEFAKIADEEGFPEIASVMRGIAVAEKYHEERFLILAKALKDGTMFKRNKPVRWRCLNCGCVVEGPEAPELCPACAHPRAYFEVLVPIFE